MHAQLQYWVSGSHSSCCCLAPSHPCSPNLKPQSMAPCLPWPLAAPGPTALFPGPVPHSCLLQASSTPGFGNNSTLDPRTSKTGCSITSLLAPPALTWPTGPRCCEFSWGFLNLSPGPCSAPPKTWILLGQNHVQSRLAALLDSAWCPCSPHSCPSLASLQITMTFRLEARRCPTLEQNRVKRGKTLETDTAHFEF